MHHFSSGVVEMAISRTGWERAVGSATARTPCHPGAGVRMRAEDRSAQL